MDLKLSQPTAARLRKGAAACATGAAALLVMLPPAQAKDGRLEGVWRATRHGVNCATGEVLSTFPAIMSFARGGSLTGYAVGPGSTPAMGSPDFGTWKRESGSGNFSFRFIAYTYDATGAYTGSTQVDATLVLAGDAQSFTYQGTVSFFDAADNPLFSVCGKASATRFD